MEWLWVTDQLKIPDPHNNKGRQNKKGPNKTDKFNFSFILKPKLHYFSQLTKRKALEIYQELCSCKCLAINETQKEYRIFNVVALTVLIRM